MSLFNTEQVQCPACGESVEFNVVYSINADRKPALREDIIKGRMQREDCPNCGRTLRLDPELTYIDVGRRQWMIVRPVDKLEVWEELETECRETFEDAYGPSAPADARTIGREMQVRVTFGWAALREKIMCRERGLDDVTLELVKTALLRNLDDSPLADDTELRLDDVEGDELALLWIKSATQEPVEQLRVPRALYDEIAADQSGWQTLREQLSAGPYVDVNRLLVVPA